jgi:hypothetical protein
MMSRSNGLILVVSAAVGVGAFLTARASGGASSAPTDTPPLPGRSAIVAQWLGLTEDQCRKIKETDPNYWQDVADLKVRLASERDRFAALLESTSSTDQAISEQAELLIALVNQLERRVLSHILSIRGELTPDQQTKLFNVCALGIRQGMAWCDGKGGRGRLGTSRNRGHGMDEGPNQGGSATSKP